jgi:3-hydroxybutyryl-CoA dehydrogenase
MIKVENLMVMGSGLMGLGIAHVGALGGLKTIVYDINEKALGKAEQTIRKNLQKGIERGKLTPDEMSKAMAHLSFTLDLGAAASSQLIIEAVPEDMGIKIKLFRALDEVCPPEVYYATNTSALSITELAASTNRPDRFIGMHFFNPVHMMKLIEVIRGLETSTETLEMAFEVSKTMGKEPVEVNEYPGFVTSRINAMIGNEAFYMLESGIARARDIDKAIKLGLNHPMGPFEMIDLVGLDTRLHIMEYLHSTLGEKFRPCPLHVKYVKAGRLGRKSGKGVYEYE